MLVTTEPVLLLAYGQYEGDDGKPFARKDGTVAEYADVYDGENVRRVTLSGQLNGERPAAGKAHRLLLDTSIRRKPAFSRGGNEYVAEKDKWTLLGAA